MTTLKPGDPCPCCGQPIQTDDPRLLGYLSAMQDILGPPAPLPEAPLGLVVEDGKIVKATDAGLFSYYLRTGHDDLESYMDFRYRFISNGGVIVEGGEDDE